MSYGEPWEERLTGNEGRPMPDRTTFPTWLGGRTDQQHIGTARLAHHLSVSPMTVYKWIHGKSVPWSGLAERLAEVLGVTVEELRAAMGDTDQTATPSR